MINYITCTESKRYATLHVLYCTSPALPPGSGSRFAEPPAWHGLPQCPGYGHWVSYSCMSLVRGFGFPGNPAIPDLGLGCACLGTGFGFAPQILAGVAPPILAGVLGRACLCARSGYTPSSLPPLCGGGVCAWVRPSAVARHSWLGCWGVCVCVCVCVLRLYPATPCSGSWCVCLGSGVRFHVANSGCGVGVWASGQTCRVGTSTGNSASPGNTSGMRNMNSPTRPSATSTTP